MGIILLGVYNTSFVLKTSIVLACSCVDNCQKVPSRVKSISARSPCIRDSSVKICFLAIESIDADEVCPVSS